MQPSILIFIGSLGSGGAERVTAGLAAALDARGHCVTLVTIASPAEDAYPLPDSIVRRQIGPRGTHRGLAKLIVFARRVHALRRMIRSAACSTVLAMMYQESVMAILAARGLQVRTVVSERTAFWMRRRPGYWNLLFRLLMRHADARVVQTREIGDRLCEETRSPDVEIIPNAVRLPLEGRGISVLPRSVIDPNARVILLVGSKSHAKGFDRALDAFCSVEDAHPAWCLVFVGLDSARGQRMLESVPTRVRTRIHLIETVSNIEDWYRRADLFLLSSRYEGMPNALLEAMAVGTACIAVDCSTGPRDLIKEGLNGVLVPANDPAALMHALVRLMEDQTERRRVALAATSVRSSHSPERIHELWGRVLFASDGPGTAKQPTVDPDASAARPLPGKLLAEDGR